MSEKQVGISLASYNKDEEIKYHFDDTLAAAHPDLYKAMLEKNVSLSEVIEEVRRVSGPNEFKFPEDVYDYLSKMKDDEEKTNE